MPLDPSIALSYKPIQLEDPLSNYAKALQVQGLQHQNAVNALQAQEAQREYDNQNALRSYLAANKNQDVYSPGFQNALAGFGKVGRETGKYLTDIEKARLETKTANANFIAKKLENNKQLLSKIDPTNPNAGQQLLMALRAEYADEDMKDFYKNLGVPYSVMETNVINASKSGKLPEFMQQMQKGLDVLKTHYLQQNTGAQTRVLAVNPNTGRATVVKGSEAAVTKTPGSGTNVNVTIGEGESEFAKAYGRKSADTVSTLKTAVRDTDKAVSAADSIVKVLTSKEGAYTGSFADLNKNIVKMMPGDKKRVVNTEILTQQLAKSLLAQIKASGLGQAQGFSDKDRDFLEKATGKISFEKETLLNTARAMINGANAIRRAYNDELDTVPESSIKTFKLKKVPYVIR